MAPARSSVPDSDPTSQADTPMSDANDEVVTSIPVDKPDANMTVSIIWLFRDELTRSGALRVVSFSGCAMLIDLNTGLSGYPGLHGMNCPVLFALMEGSDLLMEL